ncbi:ComEC/Rec2 family competence protein [Aestuariimicrobium kwangyangense]|uniref:ComEC/Rec2 family competence protein n=1 Tax=Aestuariimicrobium kwangyangense TaxID=396389 RepID=UPI0003B57027|nr:ComEC/Rec2 family competence protein [Aestuariimicrobium kwangyangense]
MGAADRPAERPDLRMVATAAIGWAVTFFCLTATSPSIVLVAGGGAVLAMAAAARGRWQLSAVAVVGCCLAVTTSLRVGLVHDSPTADLAAQRAAGSLTCVVTSDVRLRPAQGVRPEVATVVVRVVSLDARGRQLRGGPHLTARASGELAEALSHQPAGATVVLQGRLGAAEPDDPTAGSFTVRAPPVLVRGPGWADRTVNRMRAALVHATRHSPPDQAALLPSLVVGDTSRLRVDVVEQFKATGLTHLTAVSGSNLVLLLGFGTMVATRLGARGTVLRMVQVGAVLGFVVLCRVEPSVVRAAAMGLVALAALGRSGVGRAKERSRGMRHLAVAVLALMVVDPWLSRSWGFALSAGATAALIACASAFQRAMAWAPAWLAEAVAVPLAAQLATQPLVTALSGTLSVSGLVANALAGPFVGPATVLGMLAAFTSLLPGRPGELVGGGFGWLGGWTVEPLLRIARLGAALPGGSLTWPASPAGLTVISVLSLALCWLAPMLLRRRWLLLALGLVLLLALGRAPASPGWPGRWQVTFCSVGQGDAAVLRAGRGQAVVVDVGPDPKPVVTCLRQLGLVALPVVVITHFHADHLTGLGQVLDTFRVGRIVISREDPSSASAREVHLLAASHGVPVVSAHAGEQWRVGSVTWETIRTGPVAGDVPATGSQRVDPENSSENDASVMGVATVGAVGDPRGGPVRVLLAGDSEPDAQRAALRALTDDSVLRVDVMAMPHHGSSRQEKRFWQAAGAQVAVSSSGVDNDYGHPAVKAVDLAHSLGMRVAQTNELGSIAIRREDGSLVLVSNRGPQR